jgi:quinol monooxygenase YgiN
MFQEETSRADFMKTTAIAGAAAVTASFGFNRMASAAESDEQIVQLAIFKYDPERKDQAAEGLAKLAAAVEEKEPDVLAYIPYMDEKANEVVFYEIYKNAAAVANHSKQPHMRMLGPLVQNGVLIMPLKIVALNQVGGFHR